MYQAAKGAVQLVGNASAKSSHLRHKKVASGLNSSLMPLVEEDKNFSKAPPTHFGTKFAKRSKDYMDQIKAMHPWSTQAAAVEHAMGTFFRGGPTSSRGGGGRNTGYRQGRGGAYRPHNSHNS